TQAHTHIHTQTHTHANTEQSYLPMEYTHHSYRTVMFTSGGNVHTHTHTQTQRETTFMISDDSSDRLCVIEIFHKSYIWLWRDKTPPTHHHHPLDTSASLR